MNEQYSILWLWTSNKREMPLEKRPFVARGWGVTRELIPLGWGPYKRWRENTQVEPALFTNWELV